jgi:hypothetical protein
VIDISRTTRHSTINTGATGEAIKTGGRRLTG